MSVMSIEEVAAPLVMGGEFLTFQLGEAEYGVDILKVQEIRTYDTIRQIPNAPAHIKGTINLRGVTVPIVDLRLKLDMDAVRYDAFTAVIVLSVAKRVVGVVVDSVLDVAEIERKKIEAVIPAHVMDAEWILGVGNAGSRKVILTDVDRLLAADDLSLAQAA